MDKIQRCWGEKFLEFFPARFGTISSEDPALPTAALVTDIGNDLLYGVPRKRILDWVAQCLDRLADVGASTIVTQLPIASIERLSEARFRFFQTVIFPRSKLTLSAAKDLARGLNEELIALGQSRKIPVISAAESWYGFDPIHLKRRVWREAWPSLLASWHMSDTAIEVPRTPLRSRAYLAMLPPSERTLFGIRRCAAQPSGRLPDGTTISLY